MKYLFFIVIIMSFSTHAQLSHSLIGITVSDSYYYKPVPEPGDLNIGFSFNHYLNSKILAELNTVYAVEGLHEIWLQPKLNLIFLKKKVIQPFLTGGLNYQYKPSSNLGAIFGVGLITPVQPISPFLKITVSSSYINMFNEPDEHLWEVIRIGLLVHL